MYSSLKFHEPGAFTTWAPRFSRACQSPNTAPSGSAHTAGRPARGMSTGGISTFPPLASTTAMRVVGRVDPDGAGPPGPLGVRQRGTAEAADDQAVEPGVGVALGRAGRRADLVGPAEQVAVERHGGVEVGLDDVDPARHAGRVSVSLEHGGLLVGGRTSYPPTVRRQPGHGSGRFGGPVAPGHASRSRVDPEPVWAAFTRFSVGAGRGPRHGSAGPEARGILRGAGRAPRRRTRRAPPAARRGRRRGRPAPRSGR